MKIIEIRPAYGALGLTKDGLKAEPKGYDLHLTEVGGMVVAALCGIGTARRRLDEKLKWEATK